MPARHVAGAVHRVNPTPPAPSDRTKTAAPGDATGAADGQRAARVRLDSQLRGLLADLPTPFSEDAALDLDGLRALTSLHLAAGAGALLVLGPAGEGGRLSADERLQVVRVVAKAAGGQVPILAGLRSAGLDNLILAARRAMDVGAGGVLVAPLPGLTTDEAVYGYFDQIASRLADIPWALLDDPATTGVHLASYLLIRMIADFPNLTALAYGDASDVDKLATLRDAQRQGGRRAPIFAARQGIDYPLALGRGVDGVAAAVAYPEALVKTRDLYEAGKREDAEDIHDAYLPLLRHAMQGEQGLAVTKYLLARRGVLRCDRLRAPGRRLTVVDCQESDHLVRRMERRTRQLGIGLPIDWRR